MAKKWQLQALLSRLPPAVLRLVENFHRNGIHSILVGGSVRDFFLKGDHTPVDLDFEIRHQLPLHRIEALVGQSRPQTMESLPFDIIRSTMEGVTLELAPPRKEKYPPGTWFKHHQFEAVIDPALAPKQAWLRRDFTVNAMGVDLASTALVDPFDGMKDLKNRILRPCGPSFVFDPVRFLRLLRFQSQLGCSLHPDTERELTQFNLKGLSAHHFFKESFKTPFFPFVQNFFDTIKKHSLHLPEEMEPLEFLCHRSLPSPNNLEDLLMTLIYAPSPLSPSQLKHFIEYAKMGISDMRQHCDFRQNLEQIGPIDKNFLKIQGEQLSLQDFLDLRELQWIKKAYRFLLRNDGRHPFAHSLERVHPSLFQALSNLQNLFPPELEGEMPFPPHLPPHKREEFRLYRHLMCDKEKPGSPLSD